MSPAADRPHCITCADEGIEMEVVSVTVGGTQSGAQCRDRCGSEQRVAIDLVEPVEIGDLLLVHAGVAISKLETTAR